MTKYHVKEEVKVEPLLEQIYSIIVWEGKHATVD